MLITFLKKSLCLVLLTFSLLTLSFNVKSQEYVPVEVAQNKALNIFFPSNVAFCDAGASVISFEINEKIVKVKSTLANFPETNLTVITADSLCYNFLLLYNELPRVTIITADVKKAKKLKNIPVKNIPQKEKVVINTPVSNSGKTAVSSTGKTTSRNVASRDTIISRNCRRMFNTKPEYYDIAVVKKGMVVSVSNIETDDSSLYITLAIKNRSKIDYNIAFVNFQIFETEQFYKEANRDIIKRPIYIFNTKEVIRAHSTEKIVYTFDKFKIGKKQQLYIEVGEKNGMRLFTVKIPSSLLQK